MIKMVIMLERKPDLSHEEFADYWLHEHAPMAEEMPNLMRYQVDLPTDAEKAPYDGIAELYFEDMAALGEAFESEAGQRVEADAESFAADQTTMIVEETVRLDRT